MRSLSILLLFVLTIRGSAKLSYGVLSTLTERFAYLDRFCFVSELGNLNFTLRFPADVGLQSLLLYYDVTGQWDSVYKSNKTCEEKVATLDPENNQQIRLTPYEDRYFDATTRCYIDRTSDSTLEFITCRGNRRFVSQRSRWWYLAISNCEDDGSNLNESNGVYVEYVLEMTNGDPGDFWFYHFSADEFYILPVDIVFFLLQTAIFLLSITVAYILRKRNLLHQTFKIYLEAVAFEVLSLLCFITSYGTFAQDGVGLQICKMFGEILRASSTILFVFLLLLIAKGYTITRGRLSTAGAVKLTIIITLFVMFYMAMFIWSVKVFDPAEVTYISESVPGYLLAALRVFAWAVYIFSSSRTLAKYPSKRAFYAVFGLLMTLWFWMGPISLVIAKFVLDNWVREEVVNLVDNCVALYGFIVFLILTWPTSANKNFPYHVRTTQIADCSNTADFPQNAYEVRFDNSLEAATIEHAAASGSISSSEEH